MNTAAVQEERGPRVRNRTILSSQDSDLIWKSCADSSSASYYRFDSSTIPLTLKMSSTNLNVHAKSLYEARGNGELLLPGILRQSQSSRILGHEMAMQYEVSAQIFLATIRGARRHRDFSSLDMNEQNAILRRGWAAAFVLHVATWPFDLTNIRPKNATITKIRSGAPASLTAARSAILKLHLDEIEFSILETFVLCRPEITETSEGFRLTSKAREIAVEAIINHLQNQGDHGHRLTQIMFVLPILTGYCPSELSNDLFAPIIGDIDLERVIESIR